MSARAVLAALEELRVAAAELGGGLKEGVAVGVTGGTVRIELNHVSQCRLPDALRCDGNHDVRILAVAYELAHEQDSDTGVPVRQVVVVSAGPADASVGRRRPGSGRAGLPQ